MTTTPEEVWQLLRELVQAQKETERRFQETDRQIKEVTQQQKKTDELLRQIGEQQKKTDEQQKKTDEQLKKTDRTIKELGKQIGGLSSKFGSFTEGLALPSMTKILQKKFKMDVISPRVKVRKGGAEMEIDVLAYSNGNVNSACVVEVKSHAKEESIEQLKNTLNHFADFFPEHENKRVYGILTAVDISAHVRQQALKEGLYVARIQDEVFKLKTPKNFQAKVW